MAWEGALGVVPDSCDGFVVSPEFPVFEVDMDRVLPEVLDVYFRTPQVWAELAAISSGSNARRRRLNPTAFLNYEMTLPSMAVQQQIRSVHQQSEAFHAQASTDALDALDALLASAVGQAFA
jgi:type I restriction enzyme S subunit